jgi:hypothetical protein
MKRMRMMRKMTMLRFMLAVVLGFLGFGGVDRVGFCVERRVVVVVLCCDVKRLHPSACVPASSVNRYSELTAEKPIQSLSISLSFFLSQISRLRRLFK